MAFALPLVVTSPSYLQMLILLLFYAYLTSSWNLVGGFAGVLPLGHAAFVALGAYTSTLLYLQYGISPWLGMLVGGVVAALVGVIIGIPTLKMRGAYFALATIAFAEAIRVLIENTSQLGPFKVNGPRGLLINLKGNSFAAYQFTSKASYYYIMLVLLLVVLGVTALLMRSKLGYYLSAGGEEPGGGAGAGRERRQVQAAGHGALLLLHRPGRDLLRPADALHRAAEHLRSQPLLRDRLHRPDRRPRHDPRPGPRRAAAAAAQRADAQLSRRACCRGCTW